MSYIFRIWMLHHFLFSDFVKCFTIPYIFAIYSGFSFFFMYVKWFTALLYFLCVTSSLYVTEIYFRFDYKFKHLRVHIFVKISMITLILCVRTTSLLFQMSSNHVKRFFNILCLYRKWNAKNHSNCFCS